MNKKLRVLILTLTPILIVNCSGKNPPQNITVQSRPITTEIKAPIIYPTIHKRPKEYKNPELLGRPIQNNTPTSIKKVPTQTPPPKREEIKETTTHHTNSVKGTSRLVKKFKLPNSIKESSALIKIDGKLWTINDSGGEAKLYQISETDGKIVKTVTIKGAYNHDWEALAYDNRYVYIGDFGNNRGNRRDLKIYKISRADLKNRKSTRAKTINFSYSDQKSFQSKPRKHNFDCEAMVAYKGKLYLFSKDWQDQKTRMYELSTKTGRQIAKYKDSFNVQGLITDATINTKLDILLLTSYSKLLNVTVWAFTNYKQSNFFKGESKKLTLNSLNAQIEGITFIDNYKAYLSSEAFSKYIFSFDANLYHLDFSSEFK